jgi:hypothetical protein
MAKDCDDDPKDGDKTFSTPIGRILEAAELIEHWQSQE